MRYGEGRAICTVLKALHLLSNTCTTCGRTQVIRRRGAETARLQCSRSTRGQRAELAQARRNPTCTRAISASEWVQIDLPGACVLKSCWCILRKQRRDCPSKGGFSAPASSRATGSGVTRSKGRRALEMAEKNDSPLPSQPFPPGNIQLPYIWGGRQHPSSHEKLTLVPFLMCPRVQEPYLHCICASACELMCQCLLAYGIKNSTVRQIHVNTGRIRFIRQTTQRLRNGKCTHAL